MAERQRQRQTIEVSKREKKIYRQNERYRQIERHRQIEER